MCSRSVNVLEPAVDKDGHAQCRGNTSRELGNSTWNRKKTTLFSRLYLRNRSTSDMGVFGYIGVF